MRQAVEAQVLNPHCELGEQGQWDVGGGATSMINFTLPVCSLSISSLCLCVCVAGLRQILTDVIEEVRQSLSPDIDGADVLHSLLNAPWLQSLLRV